MLCVITPANDDVFNTLFWGDSGVISNNVRSKPFFIFCQTFVLQLAQQQYSDFAKQYFFLVGDFLNSC